MYRAELREMKKKELFQKACEVGIPEATREECDEQENAREAIIAMLLQAPLPACCCEVAPPTRAAAGLHGAGPLAGAGPAGPQAAEPAPRGGAAWQVGVADGMGHDEGAWNCKPSPILRRCRA